ncbi:outer membrane beta-barrel protein [Colwellia echini]|uniref:Porin family protein n=1 Tax=Colwellia echini TaxID=1982103 RepID=A0ABY3MXC2_9GAMM|nr:outer membrane beta-barrel protein [Colwellia echini]TYK65848.1 porin family protein [Colwellia echini]
MIFKNMSKMMMIGSVVGLLASTISTDALANYSHRGERWESTFKVNYDLDASVNTDGGATTDLNSGWGWGFTLGYNLNQHILLNYDFSASTPSYNTTITTDSGLDVPVSQVLDKYDSQFNVVYNVLTSAFTPYVQAGAGWSYMDSNIADGPPSSVCWYDPWWGYICNGYQSTYDDTAFSYNVAVGVRYELPNYLFFRASYKQSWVDLKHSDTASLGGFQVEIGSMF